MILMYWSSPKMEPARRNDCVLNRVFSMIFEHEFLELHELLFSLLTFVLCQQETDDVPENLQNCFPCFVHNRCVLKVNKVNK